MYLEFNGEPDAARKTATGERRPERRHSLCARAVHGVKALDGKLLQRFCCPCNSFIRGRMQMHAAQNCMQRLSPGQMANIIQRIDYSGMGTAKNNNRAGGSFLKKGLIIQKRISLPALFVKAKSRFALFLGMGAGDFPGQEHAGGNFRRCSDHLQVMAAFA